MVFCLRICYFQKHGSMIWYVGMLSFVMACFCSTMFVYEHVKSDYVVLFNSKTTMWLYLWHCNKTDLLLSIFDTSFLQSVESHAFYFLCNTYLHVLHTFHLDSVFACHITLHGVGIFFEGGSVGSLNTY